MKIRFGLLSFIVLVIFISLFMMTPVFSKQVVSRGKTLEPVGGWVLNEFEMISSYKSADVYRLALERILRRDSNGVPIVLIQDKMDFSLKGTDYISRGSNYCLTTQKKDPNLVVLLNKKGVYKAWTIKSSKFLEIPIKGIKCFEGDEN